MKNIFMITIMLIIQSAVFAQNTTSELRRTIRQQNENNVSQVNSNNYQQDNTYWYNQETITTKSQYDYQFSQNRQQQGDRDFANGYYDSNRPQGLTLPEAVVALGATYLNVKLATSPNLNIYPSFVRYQPQRFFSYPTYNQPWNSLSNQIDRTRYLYNFNGGGRVYGRNPYTNNFILANVPIGWFR